MAHLVTCDGYRLIADYPLVATKDLPALCRAAEEQRDDGFAVLAFENGRLVADAEGRAGEGEGEDRHYQAQYAYACGYHD